MILRIWQGTGLFRVKDSAGRQTAHERLDESRGCESELYRWLTVKRGRKRL
jgi:hypothetical protein